MKTDNDIIEKIKNYKNILSAIIEQYLCIFALDIQNGIVYDVKNDMKYQLPENRDALQQTLFNQIEKFTVLENIPKMKYFTDLSSLEERFGDKKMISKIFLGKDYSWCNSKFIRMDEEKSLRYVLCIIERVDEQILFFEKEQKEVYENKKLHSMMDAFLEEYNTVCSVNLDNMRVEFSQLSERLKDSYQKTREIRNAEEIAKMYIAMAIHEDDRDRISQILTKEYIEEKIEVGSSAYFLYRNEIGSIFEMRIYRSSTSSVFLGFKDKTFEIEKINNKIYTDSLTGVKNRKYYDDKVVDKICSAVIICDIDYFKNFNDTYGHQFGDYVISLVANTLRNCLRSTDEIIRYGGDEFVIAFGEFTTEALNGILEKMRNAIESIEIKEYPNLHLSMSFGAVYGNGIVKQMLSTADAALYESKKTRNAFTIENYEKSKIYTKK